ncbi:MULTISPECIES: hypothetical protein [Pseudomonas]|jgi:hypothetical protein|nr:MULTISPECIES: hypothetical protein [Pseudomonas]MCE1038024.1 hypothetical protein [Pseudomonas monteilii]MCL8328791.1 hypothetical protein [Pseudomonas juntendi]UJW25413.1 hypothetical protein L2Y89_27890 [Pseudomonas juntendi]WBM30299.1 hypothetical protein M2J79_33695 [Pseudomonas aeruginosa]HEJ6554296.1 hypothetical protein [Pseudomonas aeruginosa]
MNNRIVRFLVGALSLLVGLAMAVNYHFNELRPLNEGFQSALFMMLGLALIYKASKPAKKDNAMPAQWTDQQLAAFEAAMETIGNMIALKARDIHAERSKGDPNQALIDQLRAEQAELVVERSQLRIDDSVAVAHAIERYGPIVKASV